MSKIAHVSSPQVPDPPPGTWSNCLVVDGVAYIAGMTAGAAAPNTTPADEYAQAKRFSPRSNTWWRRPAAAWPTSSR